MATTITETFESTPAQIRAGLKAMLQEKVPEFAHLLTWDETGTRASGSKLGAKGSIELRGSGPTVLTLVFTIGFPASMKFSEAEVARRLRAELKDLKSRVS